MPQEVLVVFTFKPIDRLLREGGTSSWKLNWSRARRCRYAICTRNALDERRPAGASEPHHQGFLVGKIRDVALSPDRPERKRALVEFSEYALIDIPEVWKGDRNPVRYEKVEDLDIDFDALDWQPMPSKTNGVAEAPAEPSQPVSAITTGDRPLTMAEAKKGLALTFGVAPEAIEITIRG
jgi:hypothetical protein